MMLKKLIEYVENELRNALETNRLQKLHKPVNVSVKGGHWWVKSLISPDESIFLYFPDFPVAKELMLH